MNKINYLILFFLATVLIGLVACDETEGVDEYADWQERNEAFMDSIANLAILSSSTTEWQKIQGVYNKDRYVYIQVKEEGEGPVALYTDSVKVNYRVKNIEGRVLDQTYTTEVPDLDFSVPQKFLINNTTLIEGFVSALQHMRVGDRWVVYMPWNMAYGASGGSGVRGYSTLIYDIQLTEILAPK